MPSEIEQADDFFCDDESYELDCDSLPAPTPVPSPSPSPTPSPSQPAAKVTQKERAKAHRKKKRQDNASLQGAAADASELDDAELLERATAKRNAATIEEYATPQQLNRCNDLMKRYTSTTSPAARKPEEIERYVADPWAFQWRNLWWHQISSRFKKTMGQGSLTAFIPMMGATLNMALEVTNNDEELWRQVVAMQEGIKLDRSMEGLVGRDPLRKQEAERAALLARTAERLSREFAKTWSYEKTIVDQR